MRYTMLVEPTYSIVDVNGVLLARNDMLNIYLHGIFEFVYVNM